MGKVICIYNQKGGVGKTTTVVNLASSLGILKKKVLVIDMDPQGNASSGLGIDKAELNFSVYDYLMGDDLKSILLKSSALNVDILPSKNDLAGFEIEAVSLENREYILKNRINELDEYDYILIDCPPSIGLLSLNALCAANSVLIPIQTEYYALEGVSQLVETIDLIKKGLNKDLKVEGVLLSMYDGRTRLSLEVVEEVKKYFKSSVFKTIIPRNIRLAEAPSNGLSIFDYDEKSKGADAFRRLGKEIVKNNRNSRW